MARYSELPPSHGSLGRQFGCAPILKQSLVADEKKHKVIESYDRVCKVLANETAHITKTGPSVVPEIDFDVVESNDGALPDGLVDLVRTRGCVIFRNVVPEKQAVAWETELKEYTSAHKSVGGFPEDDPQNWSLWWTRPQVQIRSHPRVLAVMKAVGKLWHVEDPTLPVDLDTQVAYPDRFRIRYPSLEMEYTLNAHLDSGAIERWEDPAYRRCYQKVFDGEWEDYDAWSAGHRPDANMDLYNTGANCSCWRSMQGWLSLSNTGTGEGTLRLLPSLKASTAYLLLRPFFVNGEKFDNVSPTFPGAAPGNTQLLPTKELHPHLIHEVDKFNPGKNDSSVSYYPCSPLTPYNLQSMLRSRDDFLAARPPRDFQSVVTEEENEHEDHGARTENILTTEGLQAMGLRKFDEDENGLTEGQKLMRRMANKALGFTS